MFKSCQKKVICRGLFYVFDKKTEIILFWAFLFCFHQIVNKITLIFCLELGDKMFFMKAKITVILSTSLKKALNFKLVVSDYNLC